jgi:hypothetical protein
MSSDGGITPDEVRALVDEYCAMPWPEEDAPVRRSFVEGFAVAIDLGPIISSYLRQETDVTRPDHHAERLTAQVAEHIALMAIARSRSEE